jgi:hypothetical protein
MSVTSIVIWKSERIHLNFLAVIPIIVDPFSPNPIPIPFLDKDQQAWTVEAYIEEQCFIIRLYYSDIFKIPTDYVRSICFNITVRNFNDTKITTSVFPKPVTKYYSQKENDEGLEISTTLDVEEVSSTKEDISFHLLFSFV